LNNFYNNNHNFVKDFLQDLVSKIIEKEFLYSDEKLNAIVDDLKLKLSSQQINYVQERLKITPSEEWH